MQEKKYRFFMSDFETTVYEGQINTEVWCTGIVELFHDDVKIMHSIDELFEFFKKQRCNCMFYFHNLKFDGEFWISFLLTKLGFTQAYIQNPDNLMDIKWLRDYEMPWNSFKYSISSKGLWYSITVRFKNFYLKIVDSLKLLPFSVDELGRSFGTKHRKSTMEYKGYRYAGCNITPEEQQYFANDLYVPKEALEIMNQEGYDKLTIGSCCLAEFKNIREGFMATMEYDEAFPNLYDYKLDSEIYGYESAGEYIRRGYRGGWVYVVKGKEKRILHKGLTADVNSLYPSVMHSKSGNRYPVGLPTFWSGNYIPNAAIGDNKYYYIKVRTRFYLKKGKLPFIQIKNNFLYDGTECLETSDVFDYERHRYTKSYIDRDGKEQPAIVELTMTMTDWELMQEHYNLEETEILSGCWFYAATGIFDAYIDKYAEIKKNSKGARRGIAKLFLNNLYGRFATNTDSSFKVAYIKDDGSIGYFVVPEYEKEPGYIAIGAAITSYARYFTITAAQLNYYGPNKRGFVYADTDSIHCDLQPHSLKGVTVHPTEFCCWKLESYWDDAIFTRQKTYIEHVTHEDGEPIEHPYHLVKCAGMPKKCKELFITSILGTHKSIDEYSIDEAEFLFDKRGKPIIRTLKDFDVGLCIPGKLRPKRLPGGIVLVDTTYKMR